MKLSFVTLLSPGMNWVAINVFFAIGGDDFLTSFSPGHFTTCLVCETDVEIETHNEFSSTTAEYQLLTSHRQLVGHDYSFWASRCSGRI